MFLRKKIGLVLGGGGARGFFHIGVINALQDLRIEVNEIAGTSIGAIIGIIYAANPLVDFKKIVEEFNFSELIMSVIPSIKINSIDKMEKFLEDYVPVKKIEDLRIKFRFNATDINSRKEVIFSKGNIFPALIASISIPGVFKPINYHDKFLVDGGVSNNIPITLIEKSKKILVSDITGPIKKVDSKSKAVDTLYSSIAIMQQKISLEKAKNIRKKIIYLNLEDDKTFILDFRKKNYQYLINLGYQAIMNVKNSLF